MKKIVVVDFVVLLRTTTSTPPAPRNSQLAVDWDKT